MSRPSFCRSLFSSRLPSGRASLLALVVLLAGCAGNNLAGSPGGRQAGQQPSIASGAPQTITKGAAKAPSAATGETRVALLVPLSGPSAGLGRALLDAAQLALFDVGDDNLNLIPRDTQGTPEGAAQAAQAAIADGAQLILGPLLASEVEAVKPVAAQGHVNMVAFTTNDQLAGNGTYLLSVPPRLTVDRVLAYAHERGLQRIAALAPDNPYGQLVVGEARAVAPSLGQNFDHVQMYDPTVNDLRPIVRQLAGYDQRQAALGTERSQLQAANDDASRQALKRLDGEETLGDPDFDAVLLPDGGGKLKAVASLLPYYDVDTSKIRLLGTGLWDEPGLASEPALLGGWFAAPDPAARADFERRFKQIYKSRPPRLATLGYDAGALAAVLAKKAPGIAFSQESLTDPSGFAGADGIFRFRPDGRIERGLSVLEVQKGGAKVISPAPDTFQQPPVPTI